MKEVQYVSPETYNKMTGLGVEEIKRQCRIGKIECFMTEGGHYKILVRQNAVSREEYEKVVRENEKLKTIIQSVNLATSI